MIWAILRVNDYSMMEVHLENGLNIGVDVSRTVINGSNEIAVISLVVREITGDIAKLGKIRQLIYPIYSEADNRRVEDMTSFLNFIAQNMNTLVWEKLGAGKHDVDLCELINSEERSRLMPTDVDHYAYGYENAKEWESYMNIYTNGESSEALFEHMIEYMKSKYIKPKEVVQEKPQEEK